jgi:hypothetical protein
VGMQSSAFHLPNVWGTIQFRLGVEGGRPIAWIDLQLFGIHIWRGHNTLAAGSGLRE